MADDATVSVVIPCYNGAPFLRDTLGSATNQSHPPIEVLVVDDGSTDDSAAIADSFGPPVRVIRQENQGESVARNRGIDEARGSWIAFLDADDLWEPTKLQRQLEVAGTDALATHTEVRFFGDRDGVSNVASTPENVRYTIERMCVSNPVLNGSSLMVRASSKVRFPTWTRYSEDLVYCLDLSLSGTLRLVPEPLTRYRIHSASQSSKPGIEARWFETVTGWLELRRADLGDERVASIRAARLAALAERLETYRWRGQWRHHSLLRRFLRSCADDPQVARALARSPYPSWLYRLKDRLDRWMVRR